MTQSIVERILAGPSQVEDPMRCENRIHPAKRAFRLGQDFWLLTTPIILTGGIPVHKPMAFDSLVEQWHWHAGIDQEIHDCTTARAGNLGLIHPRTL